MRLAASLKEASIDGVTARLWRRGRLFAPRSFDFGLLPLSGAAYRSGDRHRAVLGRLRACFKMADAARGPGHDKVFGVRKEKALWTERKRNNVSIRSRASSNRRRWSLSRIIPA